MLLLDSLAGWQAGDVIKVKYHQSGFILGIGGEKLRMCTCAGTSQYHYPSSRWTGSEGGGQRVSDCVAYVSIALAAEGIQRGVTVVKPAGLVPNSGAVARTIAFSELSGSLCAVMPCARESGCTEREWASSNRLEAVQVKEPATCSISVGAST